MRVPGALNTPFKLAIIRRWGDQITCARETGVSQGSLSQLQRNYREPYPGELEKLRAYFTKSIAAIFRQGGNGKTFKDSSRG